MRTALVRHALTLALIAAPLGAQGIVLLPGCVQPMNGRGSPPFVPCPRGPAAVVRTATDVRVRLVDRVLRYEVTETFINRGSTVGEADYLYPLPKNAAFQDLQLEINGELTAGETFGADEARRMYEAIVRARRDPALVEWMGYGMLRARIFPIAPGEEKRVVVRFHAVAEREGDAVRVDYFGGNAAARAGGEVAGADNGRVRLTLLYPAGAGYGRPSSPTHELDAHDRSGESEVVVRGDARSATILLPVARADAASIAVLTTAPGNEDGFAMITVTPPADLARDRVTTPRDVTLVLDISGSMQGPKMDQERLAGRQFLESLRPRDRFRLIDFATDVHTFRDEFVDATPENIQAARRYLDGLDATGSTNIAGALAEALRPATTPGRLPLVLFLTDGAPTVGERAPERLIEQANAGATRGGETRRIFTFGIGADVNVTLLEQLALEGRGTSQFVRPEESVERAVSLVASRLVDPVLTDVRVRAAGGVSLSKLQPGAGVDLFAGQDVVVFARYAGSGSSRVVVEGRQGGRPVTWETTVNFPARASENPFVARLWATQRVGYLSADRRRHGGSPELDAEIRGLGERFGIPTEFTSYFVREPAQMAASGRMGAGGGGGGGGRGGRAGGSAVVPMSVAGAPAVQFEAARMAADQRAVSTTASADSLSLTLMSKVAGTSASRSATPLASVRGHTFRFENDVWTDTKPTGSLRVVTIKAYSAAYFELTRKLPELASIAALGEQITTVGRNVVISIRAVDGVETLSAADLTKLVADW